MELKIPKDVEFILKKLNENGYEAFLVGGAVRDLLLGNIPKDYDVTTNAKPKEVLETFKDFKRIELGIDYGTIGLIIDKKTIEVTTYRSDGFYSDGRHPDQVEFSEFLEEDLKRRDYTINTLVYGLGLGLVDKLGGIKDLNEGLIRVVGDGDRRFKEDYLRILRGIKFKTRYDFKIEEDTFKSMKENVDGLSLISVERIREELFQILMSPSASEGIRSLDSIGALKIILREVYDTKGFEQFNPNHDKDVYNHTLRVLDFTQDKLEIRLAALFHDIGKVKTFSKDEKGIGHFYGHEKLSKLMAEDILNRYKLSSKTKEIVLSFIENHMINYENISEKGIKRLINRIGRENIYDFLDLQKADRLGTSEGRDISDIVRVENQVNNILTSKEPLIKKDLAIDGKDVIELGYGQGKKIGSILEYCLNLVLEKPELNNKEILQGIIVEKFHI